MLLSSYKTNNGKINMETIKKRLVHNIKNVFEKNQQMACYSVFLSPYMLDEIFNCYLVSYVGKIDLNDKETIRELLERALGINLNDLMNEIELSELYTYSKEYIQLLII